MDSDAPSPTDPSGSPLPSPTVPWEDEFDIAPRAKPHSRTRGLPRISSRTSLSDDSQRGTQRVPAIGERDLRAERRRLNPRHDAFDAGSGYDREEDDEFPTARQGGSLRRQADARHGSLSISPDTPELPPESEPEPPNAQDSPPQKTLFETGAATMGDGPDANAKEAHSPENPLPVLVAKLLSLGEQGATAEELAAAINWDARFQADNGTLLNFIRGFQTVFVASPTTDLIMLRPEALPYASHGPVPLRSLDGHRPSYRRPNKPQLRTAFLEKLGAVAYSSVAESLNVSELESIYRRRGFQTRVVEHEVLQVSDHNVTMFLFDNGAIVWWGHDRREHWMVEEDFFRRRSLTINRNPHPLIHHPHPLSVFQDAPFPVWCSWSSRKMSPDDAISVFQREVLFDHFVIPEGEETEEVKLAISFALADAAKLDYTEYALKQSGGKRSAAKVASLPQSVPLLYTAVELRKQQGALAMNRVLLQDIDESTFLWEHPWLKTFRDLTRDQLSVLQRLTFVEARISTLMESLMLQGTSGHRLFMIRSDWILILMLALDMLLMLVRLIITLYFVEPTKSETLV